MLTPYLIDALQAMPFPQYVDSVYLSANSAGSYTFPSWCKYAVMGSDNAQAFYIGAKGQVAQIATQNVTGGVGSFSGTGVMLDVEQLARDGVVISMICAVNCNIYICCYTR